MRILIVAVTFLCAVSVFLALTNIKLRRAGNQMRTNLVISPRLAPERAEVNETNRVAVTNSMAELKALESGFRVALDYIEYLDKSIGFMAFEAEKDRKRLEQIELDLREIGTVSRMVNGVHQTNESDSLRRHIDKVNERVRESRPKERQ